MTIASRIILLVVASIVSLLVLVGFSTWQTDLVYEKTNFNTLNVVPSIELLNEAAIDIGKYRVRIYRHVLSTDEAAMAKIDKNIVEVQKEIDRVLKAYEPLIADEEDKALLEAERALKKEYDQKVEEILVLSRQNRNKEAHEKLEQSTQLGIQLVDQLKKHMEYNDRLGKKASEEAVATKKQALTYSLVTVAVIAGFLGFIGFSLGKSIEHRLNMANQVAKTIASGDLTRPIVMDGSQDEVGQLLSEMEKMRKDLSRVMGQITQEALTVGQSASALATAAQQVAASSESQSQATASAAAAVEQLTVSIDHVGQSADDAQHRAGGAEKMAVESARDVGKAANQVGQIASQIQDTAGNIESLSHQVQQIGNVTTVIREVADQTNLLALNAAIEAARAGEQGRGFAVVADEVRKLAERTTQSVQEIASMITQIQDEAVRAVASMKESTSAVAGVVAGAESASASMKGIQQSAETMQASIAGISEALHEQRSASVDLAQNVEAIAQMSEENANAVSTVSDTATRLDQASSRLKSAVSHFRL